jgi:hypothetical protein
VQPLDAVREILRAIAEVRDGSFYRLWVDLTYQIKHPIPTIGFRIYQVADSDEAILGVWVSAVLPDGAEISWSVSLHTASEDIGVETSVSITDDDSTREVYGQVAHTTDPGEASSLLRS